MKKILSVIIIFMIAITGCSVESVQESTHNSERIVENTSEAEPKTNETMTTRLGDEQVVSTEIEEAFESEITTEVTDVSVTPSNEGVIELEHIDFSNDMSLYEAIDTRVATRNFVDREVDFEIITKLLWAAHGMTYTGGDQTINGLDAVTSATEVPRYVISPAWYNRYINIYYISNDGAYEYIPEDHTLVLRTEENLLDEGTTTGNNRQFRILFTLDSGEYNYDKIWGYLTVGSCIQNVNLVANVENIHVLSEGMFNKDGLKRALGLKDSEEQVILLSFGYIE